MTWRGRARAVAWLAAFLGLAAAQGTAEEPRSLPPLRDEATSEYRVVVHPDNPAREINRAFVRGAFLKKTVTWGDGETIRPVDLGKMFAARQRFAREVLNKTPAQLRAYWSQQIFSGKGVPPPEVDSAAAVIAYVRRHRGAIGYLPATVDPAGTVVLVVR
ncbi:MAG TPA: hypothetical protein VK698_05780 [Kofleriaceae bacterium]|nr:hypothetical protein [Kofleriaceae bacterium]